ncbi:MAG: long-chain fatty acid--CoA ligase, partial [Burkholderiales bacterium]
MNLDEEQTALIAANIRHARTLRALGCDDYQVPFHCFADLLDGRASEAPDKLFLEYYNDDTGEHATFTYGEFNRRVNQVAVLLSEEYGVVRGDRVATLAFNHPDPVIACFACWKLGAVAAPQNVSEDDARLAFILQNAGCRVALVRPEYLERAKRLQSQARCLETVITMDADYQQRLSALRSDFRPPADNMLEDQALLVYTSGTTGAPKGVMLSQYNLLVNAQAMAEVQDVTRDTRMMCVLPVHHVNGLCVTHVMPMFAGCSVVLNRGFKASVFWRRVTEQKINIVPVVPTILQFLCEASEDISRLDLTHLQHIICGAGTLSVTLVTRFEAQFKQKIVHGYGLSETTAFASMSPIRLPEEQRQHWFSGYGYPSIGSAIGCNEMAIHDGSGNALPRGERGEIVIRGHNVMAGYFERDDVNLETFKHGWFRSGDEGFFQQ